MRTCERYSVCHCQYDEKFLFLRAVSGTAKVNSLILPRMNCIAGVDEFPIPVFRRYQFPVRVCFTMTINKAQGQSVPGKLGIDLSSLCFAHGQLYVALSRAIHPGNVYLCTENAKSKTKNVVYPEVLSATSTASKSVINAIYSVNSVSNPQVMALIAKADDPHLLEESKIIDFDDDIDSRSDYERYELSIKRKDRANTRHAHIEIMKTTNVSAATD